MRELYVVFSHTNTGMGRFIRLMTGGTYNHVALSFRRDLRTLFSFARRRINAPLAGGFVQEHPARYRQGGGDCPVKVCCLPLEEGEYRRICRELARLRQLGEGALYNSVGAALSLFGKRCPVADAYTCVEFAAAILRLEGIVRIRQLEEALAGREIYAGTLDGFTSSRYGGGDPYFARLARLEAARATVRHFRALFGRMLRSGAGCAGGRRRV